MKLLSRHLFNTQYFHGSPETAELSIRGWALIENFAPSNPHTIKKHDLLVFIFWFKERSLEIKYKKS
jgi:hypothetical protein